MKAALAKYLAKAGNAIKGTPRVMKAGDADEYILREGGLMGAGGLKDTLKHNKKKRYAAIGGAGGVAGLLAALGLSDDDEEEEDDA